MYHAIYNVQSCGLICHVARIVYTCIVCPVDSFVCPVAGLYTARYAESATFY